MFIIRAAIGLLPRYPIGKLIGYPSGNRVLDGDLDIFGYPPGTTRVGYWRVLLVPFDSTRQAAGIIMTKL